jgi:Flp pilus assembly pilin Flp
LQVKTLEFLLPLIARHSSLIVHHLRTLLRDETATTALEYVLATLAVALGAVAGSAALGGVLINYLHRIYLVVTLPIP